MNASGTLTCPRCGTETPWPNRCDCKPSPVDKRDEACAVALFEARGKAGRIEDAIYQRVCELFGEDVIEDTSHDEYDMSIELYTKHDIAPTKEQVAALIAMGFSCGWINFPDETQISFGRDKISARHKRSYEKYPRHPRRAVSSATRASTPYPGTGRLNQAYTPQLYDGQRESAPPPYINISEAETPYEEAIITVRSPRKTDGSPGDSAFIVMTKSDLRALLLRVARYWGWIPMTEEQWQRDYYLSSPDEARKVRERIEQLRLQRDEAQRVVEETTATLAGIPTPP